MHGEPRTWVAGPAEAETVASLLADFRNHMGRDRPSDESLRASVERLLLDPSSDYLLATTQDREPHGVCQLRYRYGIWHAADDCWLEDLYVRERARGAGLGAALVDAAIERARDRGCARIELDADSGNAAALALYEGRGFSAATGEDQVRLHLRLGL